MSRVKSDNRAVKARLRSRVAIIRANVARILSESVILGEMSMIEIINTSGTGWVGQGEQAFAQGRVDTGHMRESVSSFVDSQMNKFSGAFGWGLNGHAAEDYFLEQEYGFINPWNGEDVPPMLALTMSGRKAKDNLEEKLRKNFR